MKITTCRRCADSIWWAETTEGKNMPVNAWSTPSGNVVPVDPEADRPVVRVLRKGEEPADPTAKRYLAHFVTCRSTPKGRQRART
jgi:hypothetical protein